MNDERYIVDGTEGLKELINNYKHEKFFYISFIEDSSIPYKQKVLKILEDLGFIWSSGKLPSKFTPLDARHILLYPNVRTLMYSSSYRLPSWAFDGKESVGLVVTTRKHKNYLSTSEEGGNIWRI